MLFTTALAVFALTTSVFAERSRCGPRNPHQHLLDHHAAAGEDDRVSQSAKFGSDLSEASSSVSVLATSGFTSAFGPTRIATYMHVVASANEASMFDQKMVDDQISFMNQAYAPSGFQFDLIKTTFTTNDAWSASADGSQEEHDMKSTLREGDYGDLNLYFVSNLGGGLLGVCRFPDAHSGRDDTFILDGCMIQASSMPGGDEENYNLGGTAVHETGHWFGLLHVFEGDSCVTGGDHILDTPKQGKSTSGCPKIQDTCPGLEGMDSIHNYMDYSYDACYEKFTPNQTLRMQRFFNMYRAAYTSV